MGGRYYNGRGKLKRLANLARKEHQQSRGQADGPRAECVSTPRSVHSTFQRSSISFLDKMESTLRRLQRPLVYLVVGNMAVGAYVFYRGYTKKQPSGEEPSVQTSAAGATSSAQAHSGEEPIHSRKEEGGHEGPSGTSLVSSGGATFSTPGGTPVPMPSFAATDHHPRHHHTHGENEHAGPSNTSLVGSGGATLSTPGGTPIPLPSQSLADHHLRKGEGESHGGAGPSEVQQRDTKRRFGEREIELDQNGDPITRGPSENGEGPQVMRGRFEEQQPPGSRTAAQPMDVPTSDLALEQYRQGLLQELEKRRKLVPLNREEKAWIDQEKAVIKEQLRYLPKS